MMEYEVSGSDSASFVVDLVVDLGQSTLVHSPTERSPEKGSLTIAVAISLDRDVEHLEGRLHLVEEASDVEVRRGALKIIRQHR